MQEKLSRVCAFFGLGEIRHIERAGGHAGENFFVETDNESYLIKISMSGADTDSSDAENRRRVMSYLQHLSEHRFRVVPYLRAPGGEQVFAGADFLATAQVRLGAEAPERLTERMISQVGEELAQLHLVPSGGLPQRTTWMDAGYLINAAAIIVCDYFERDGMSELVSLAESTEVDWARLPQSILHGDLFPDNTLFHGRRLVTFIDWDDVCLGASVLDFGMAVVGCCFGDDNWFDRVLYQSLYDGYQLVRPFSDQEKSVITPAVRRAGAVAAIWRFLKWNHYEVSEQPDDYYKVFWAQGLDRWEAP